MMKKGKDNINQNSAMGTVTAAVILPVAFAAVVLLAAYIAILPYIATITAAASLVSTKAPPLFGNELETIFVKDSAAKETVPEDTSVLEPDGQPAETELPSHEMIDISSIIMPKYEQHYANLSIDDLQVDCKLYYGDSDAVLKVGAGQYMGSRLPGFGRPILIAAHNTSYFRTLENIENGTIVTIETGYGIYQYEVYDMRVAKYDDETAYDLSLEEEILMLYTCYPFGSLGYKSDRLFVYAKKISGAVVNW